MKLEGFFFSIPKMMPSRFFSKHVCFFWSCNLFSINLLIWETYKYSIYNSFDYYSFFTLRLLNSCLSDFGLVPLC